MRQRVVRPVFVAALQRGAAVGAAMDEAGPFDLTATLSLLLQGGAITDLTTDEP